MLRTFIAGLSCYQIWCILAIQDLKNKYRRSVIGPLWIAISMGVTILCMGPLYGSIFGNLDPNFIPRMGFGLIIWSLISGTVNDATESLIGAAHFIKNVRLPYFIYIYRVVLRQLLMFAHNMLIFIPLYFIYQDLLNQNIFFALPSMLIMLIFLVGLSTLVAAFCARFRDLMPLVNNMTQLLFFLTPIVWPLESLPSNRQFLIELNPFFYILNLVRQPLLGQIPSLDQYLIASTIALCLVAVAGVVLSKSEHRIAYWV